MRETLKKIMRRTVHAGEVFNMTEYIMEYVGSSVMPIWIDEEKCTGCHRCVEACQTDILLPVNGKGKAPAVVYPGECWYCGACVMECPSENAIHLRHPLMNRARFIPLEELGQKGREV